MIQGIFTWQSFQLSTKTKNTLWEPANATFLKWVAIAKMPLFKANTDTVSICKLEEKKKKLLCKNGDIMQTNITIFFLKHKLFHL